MSEKRTSAVVVLLPSDPASLAVSGGEPADDLHCTLWFIPNAETSGVNKAALAAALDRTSTYFGPVSGRVMTGMFLSNDDPQASVLTLLSKTIPQVRDVVRQLVPEIPPSIYDRFKPHVTLGYGIPVQTGHTGREIVFDRLALWWRDSRVTYRLRA